MILAQVLVSRPSFPSLHFPLSQKSTCVLDPNVSESCSSSRSILGYLLDSLRQPPPPGPLAGGRVQTVPCGVPRTVRVSSEVRVFS